MLQPATTPQTPAPPTRSAVRQRPATTRLAVEAPPRGIAAAPSNEPPTVEPFRVHCYRLGDVFLALGEDALSQRRFHWDVAAAVGGVAMGKREALVFEWPQPGAAPDGHERAYRAFFLRQMERCIRAILAGKKPAMLLGHPVPQVSGPLGAHFYVAPGPFDGAAKKLLWQRLREWMKPT